MEGGIDVVRLEIWDGGIICGGYEMTEDEG